MTDRHDLVEKPEMLPEIKTQLHPAVERLLETNPTPEALEKLLALQREHEKDRARQEFAQALVALKRDLPPYVKHDKQVKYTGVFYTHASMAQILDVVQPVLSKHGFAVNSIPGQDAGKVKVTVQLKHRLGHQESADLSSEVDKSGSKNPAQGIGSTITYLTRYLTCSLLGIATSDMNEPTPNGKTASPEATDTKRNMAAIAAFKEVGKKKADLEKFLGRKAEEWTGDDLDKLRIWLGELKEAGR